MAELLLNYSADPTVVDLSRLNEMMAKVLKRETSVLDSSDNENDDEPTSPLSPLTSDNDLEHEDKQIFHSALVEKLDKNLLQPSTTSKFPHKKVIDIHEEMRFQLLFDLFSNINVFVNVHHNHPILPRIVKLVQSVEITKHQPQQLAKIPMISKVKKKEKYANQPLKYLIISRKKNIRKIDFL